MAAGVPYVLVVHPILSSELHQQKYKKLIAKALAVTTAATTTIQFNLSMWKLIITEPIKLPTTDIPQTPHSTIAKHVTQWSQTNIYRKLYVDW
jgi:hypothetical protein